jgi:hypothetical protein
VAIGESRSSQEARRAAERRARGLHLLAGIHFLGLAGYAIFSSVLSQIGVVDGSALGLLLLSIVTASVSMQMSRVPQVDSFMCDERFRRAKRSASLFPQEVTERKFGALPLVSLQM